MLTSMIGAVIIIMCCMSLGFYLAAREGFRSADLNEFKKALTIMTSEIKHAHSPLCVACVNIAKRIGAPFSGIFTQFARQLTDSQGETAYQLWLLALEGHKNKAYLHDDDWEELKSFGKTLGYLDKHMQLNAILHTTAYIDDVMQSIKEQADKNKRMYRYLGVIGGLLLVVILW